GGGSKSRDDRIHAHLILLPGSSLLRIEGLHKIDSALLAIKPLLLRIECRDHVWRKENRLKHWPVALDDIWRRDRLCNLRADVLRQSRRTVDRPRKHEHDADRDPAHVAPGLGRAAE